MKLLNLSKNKIGDEGTKQLAETHFPNLTTLLLAENQIGDEGAKALAQSVNMPQLTCLNIDRNYFITPEGAEYFSDCKYEVVMQSIPIF